MQKAMRSLTTSHRSSRSTRARNGSLRAQRGQTLLEVALLTPLLLLLVLGVIEIGRYAYISILVGNAARAGAAYGAQSLPQSADTGGIETAADNDFVNNGQLASSLTVTSATSCGCDSAGTIAPESCDAATNPTAGTCVTGRWVVLVSVTTSGTFTGLFSYPGIPSPITIERTATLNVAQN